MKHHRGFSLFELLIAMSIVSILAVIAVPMYLNYDVRAKITEGLSFAQPIKSLVTDYYLSMGSWPDSNATAGADDPENYRTQYIDSISVSKSGAGAAITITYRIDALGGNNTIIMATSDSGNGMQWTCSGGSLVEKYRPSACR